MKGTVKKDSVKRFAELAVIAILSIVMVIVLSTIIVRSAQNDDAAADRYYAGLEREYESAVRSYMNENGYINAGIMITRIVDREGGRTYTVKLHHTRLDRLDASERERIAAEVCELGFRDEVCDFHTVFVE